MERFLLISRVDDPLAYDARARMAAMNLDEGDESSATTRIQAAKSLAETTSDTVGEVEESEEGQASTTRSELLNPSVSRPRKK